MSKPFLETEQYQISSVARLTGLSVHNIRAWEKRYGVVEPERTDSKRRLYTRQDIQKLSLLKALTDAGDSISVIASLNIEQLESRLRHMGEPRHAEAVSTTAGESSAPVGVCRVFVAGEQMKILIDTELEQLPEFQIAHRYSDLEEMESGGIPRSDIDLIVVDVPTLFPETVDRLRNVAMEAGARRVLVVYGFSQKGTVDGLQSDTLVTAIRGPVNADELRLAAFADIRIARIRRSRKLQGPAGKQGGNGEIPEVRFTKAQLAQLSRISSAIQCECPQHLANLIFSLRAFESYSAECENRSPEDAELHGFLYHRTAEVRASMEEALQRVLDAEDIQV